MKALDVQDRLEYARCAVAVIRALEITHAKMRYEQLGRAIGLITDSERWEPWHQQQVKAILIVAAAVERQGLGGRNRTIRRLPFTRIVNKDGKPGAGVAKLSKIVTK